MPRKNPPPGGFMTPISEVVREFLWSVSTDKGKGDQRWLNGEGVSVGKRLVDIIERHVGVSDVEDILGTGLFGTASLMETGQVLKLTTDRMEVDTAGEITGDELRHVAHIFDAMMVRRLKVPHYKLQREVPVGIVISEYLTPWTSLLEFVDQADILTAEVRAIQRETGVAAGYFETLPPSKQRPMLREASESLVRVLRGQGYPGIDEVADGVEELSALGIYIVDVHGRNVGVDEMGVTKIFDLGLSSAPMTKTLVEINPRRKK